MEVWDLLDDKRQSVNKKHIRGSKIKAGYYHIVAEIWTVNSNKEILLTLRHPDKEIYPNLWENTGGSVTTGETSKSGAVRELFEETGIEATEDDIVLLGTRKETSAFVDTYVVRKDIPISALTMQEGETVAAKWVTIVELDQMIANGDVASPVAERLKPLRDKFEGFLEG